MAKGKRTSTRTLIAVLAFVLGLGTVPHRVCERDADALFDGDAPRVDALAESVAGWTSSELAPQTFATGSSRFDGEWTFGTYVMGALGFGQVALARGGDPRSVARMEVCLARMLDGAARAFDAEAWSGEDATAARSDRGHVAYLGYAGLALALHRVVAPGTRFDADEEAFAAALARRFAASPSGLVETYPGEVYPVDNTAALGALALHARVTRTPPPPGLAKGLAATRRAIDPATGLLAQSVALENDGGLARGVARGSGTALASYFLGFADDATSAALWRALRGELFRTVIGFGAVLENPSGSSRGDVDSGPVVFGFGVSATGFAIGASRAHGDRDAFRALYATAHLFGAPLAEARTRTYATGGPLGDAILFAMLTAPPSRGGAS